MKVVFSNIRLIRSVRKCPDCPPSSFLLVNQHQSRSSRNHAVGNRNEVCPDRQAAERGPVRGESEIPACVRDVDHKKGEHDGVGGNHQPEDNWGNLHLISIEIRHLLSYPPGLIRNLIHFNWIIQGSHRDS